MQKPPTRSSKGSKFLDIKIFIVTLSAAVTIGVWNLLSSSLLQVDASSPTPTPPQPPPTTPQDASPLPTLVVLVNLPPVNSNQASVAVPVSQRTNNQPTGSLRSVVVPTQTIIQKNAPLVNQPAQVVITVNGGGGGGGGGGGSKSASAPAAPVTATKSSK